MIPTAHALRTSVTRRKAVGKAETLASDRRFRHPPLSSYSKTRPADHVTVIESLQTLFQIRGTLLATASNVKDNRRVSGGSPFVSRRRDSSPNKKKKEKRKLYSASPRHDGAQRTRRTTEANPNAPHQCHEVSGKVAVRRTLCAVT